MNELGHKESRNKSKRTVAIKNQSEAWEWHVTQTVVREICLVDQVSHKFTSFSETWCVVQIWWTVAWETPKRSSNLERLRNIQMSLFNVKLFEFWRNFCHKSSEWTVSNAINWVIFNQISCYFIPFDSSLNTLSKVFSVECHQMKRSAANHRQTARVESQTPSRGAPVFVNLRPGDSPDHFLLKSKVVEYLKSYRLVYNKLKFGQ